MLKPKDQISPSNMKDRAEMLTRENLQLKARIAELERLTAMDTLTPLFNRRYLMRNWIAGAGVRIAMAELSACFTSMSTG